MARMIATVLALTMIAPAASAQTARWSFQMATDPITDARRGIAKIESREEITRGLSSSEVRNTAPANINSFSRYMLIVKCDFTSRGVYVSLLPPRGMSRGPASVTQRFDSAEPTTAVWSDSKTSVSIFSPDDVATFSAGAMRANRIALRIKDGDGQGVADTVTFSGAGAAAAIRQVYNACDQALP